MKESRGRGSFLPGIRGRQIAARRRIAAPVCALVRNDRGGNRRPHLAISAGHGALRSKPLYFPPLGGPPTERSVFSGVFFLLPFFLLQEKERMGMKKSSLSSPRFPSGRSWERLSFQYLSCLVKKDTGERTAFPRPYADNPETRIPAHSVRSGAPWYKGLTHQIQPKR